MEILNWLNLLSPWIKYPLIILSAIWLTEIFFVPFTVNRLYRRLNNITELLDILIKSNKLNYDIADKNNKVVSVLLGYISKEIVKRDKDGE